MTEATKQPCPFCDGRLAADGGIFHRGDCEGLRRSEMNQLQERFLRDERDELRVELEGTVRNFNAEIATISSKLETATKALRALIDDGYLYMGAEGPDKGQAALIDAMIALGLDKPLPEAPK